VEEVETDPEERSENEVRFEREENDVVKLRNVIDDNCKIESSDCVKILVVQDVDDIKDI
jgi:hypothetical protein